jgi:catalase
MMNEHYIVTLDRARLRIYAEAHELGGGVPRLEVVEAMDFPGSDGEDDDGQSSRMSESTAEPAQDESQSSVGREQQKNIHTLATELNTFLQNRPAASWDFAAPRAIYNSVVRDLSPETTQRLRHTLSEDLAHQNAEEVREHFAAAVSE